MPGLPASVLPDTEGSKYRQCIRLMETSTPDSRTRGCPLELPCAYQAAGSSQKMGGNANRASDIQEADCMHTEPTFS